MLQGLRTNIKIMEVMGTTVYTQIISSKEDAVCNTEEIREASVEAVTRVI